MDQNTLNIIISALAGLVAGHGTGATNQNVSLGPLGNSVTGMLGGLGGGIVASLIPALQQIGTTGINSSNVGGGALGGIILTAVIAALRGNTTTPTPPAAGK